MGVHQSVAGVIMIYYLAERGSSGWYQWVGGKRFTLCIVDWARESEPSPR